MYLAIYKWRKKMGHLDTKRDQEQVLWTLKLSARLGCKNEIDEERQGRNILVSAQRHCADFLVNQSEAVCKVAAILCFLSMIPLLLHPHIRCVSLSPSQTVVNDFNSPSSPIRFTFQNIPNPNNFYRFHFFISLPDPHFLMTEIFK